MLGKKLIQAAAGNVGGGPFIEELFSTYLYTGNGSTQTITNGIDLAGEGGMVWIKERTSVGFDQQHQLIDSQRGIDKYLISNATNSQITAATKITSFNSNGFTLGSNAGSNSSNAGSNYASWTFRKAPGFFDVVTYTGTGANRTVAHSLGSVPGTIIVKRTDTTADWQVYHRSLANTEYMVLNSTAAKATGTTRWNSTTPTSTVFSLGTDATVNASGGTYVAYLFAHDEQIFGETGDQSVIKCGSYTGNGSTQEINLGWEPQFLLVKCTSSSPTDWILYDTMRGFQGQNTTPESDSRGLFPNSSGVEGNRYRVHVTSTGFKITNEFNVLVNENGQNYVYIAIRRGPMKTPTSGTEVFAPTISVGGFPSFVTGFPVDFNINGDRTGSDKMYAVSRLTGTGWMKTTTTAAEGLSSDFKWDSMTGCINGWPPYIGWNFRRAPGFFDVVAYTGTGVARTVNHSLGVVPELMIVKRRTPSGSSWYVYDSINGSGYYLNLNATAGRSTAGAAAIWNSTAPTASVFTVGTDADVNGNPDTYIAYLFATCPGVSKVFSFTGNGTSQTIDCGFASGARFVLLKRTDSTGNWLVADTARGIVSGNDPLLYLDSTAAEITTLDWIDPDSSGFIVNQGATANANVNGATYIGLAIA